MDTTLETLLASPDDADRKRAVILLARPRSAPDIARIQSLAESDPSVEVRFFARRVLGFLKPTVQPGASAEPRVDTERLRRMFESATTPQKVMLLRALCEKSVTDAVPLLLELLARASGTVTTGADEGPEVIVSALLLAIGSLDGERRLETILPYLEHASPRVRENAIEAVELARRNSQKPEATLLRAYPYMLGHLADSDNGVRANAARALADLDPHAVRQTLRMMIHSNRPPMQASAAFVYRDPKIRLVASSDDVKALSKLLDSPNGSVSKQAAAALVTLEEAGIEGARESLAARRAAPCGPESESIESLQDELAEQDRELARVRERLAHADPKARIHAIGAAVDRLGAAVGPLLVDHAAHEKDTRVVQRVISGLGQIRFRPALDLLRRNLLHPDDRCRANAVEAIGRLDQQDVLPELLPLLDDRHHRVRANAAVALKGLSEAPVMRTLERLAESQDEMGQRASVHALGEIEKADTVTLLERLGRSGFAEVAARSRKLLSEIKHQALRESRTVRVFVSSTFRDMHAERDHLVTVTFPELRDRLAELGLEFFDVDLRWGVPAQGADNERANSWAYCKRWIGRCRPLFLSMLGQRYGWRPETSAIADTKDAHVSPELSKDAAAFEGLSVTEMEIRHAVLSGRIDRRSYFYFRETPVPPDAPVAAHQEYVDLADVGRLAALKAEIEKSGHPVRRYHPSWSRDRFTGLAEFGSMVLEDLWSGVLRDPRYVSREVWRKVLGKDPLVEAVYTDDREPVPRAVWEQLVEEARPKPLDPLEAERRRMAEFAADRLRWFRGRETVLANIVEFVEAASAPDASRLLVVSAVPGQGKTALLAKLSQHVFAVPHVLISHFVGATETSSDPRALLDRLIEELTAAGVMKAPEEKRQRDFESLRKAFVEWAASYEDERRVVLVIDAVNQLEDGETIDWLPAKLGKGLRVVVSSIDHEGLEEGTHDARVAANLKRRDPAPVVERLPGLEPLDVLVIVIEYLREYCKELDEGPINAICAMEQSRNPLYLMVMLNELRTLGGNEMHQVVPRLIAELPVKRPRTMDLFDWVLERLEVFGSEEVRYWCSYLALGRVGMASVELADLLVERCGAAGREAAYRIERALRRHLVRRGELLDFYHGQLRAAVLQKYVRTDEAKRERHREVAENFRDHADPAGDGTWAGDRARPLAEVTHHQAGAALWDGLAECLTNRHFCEAVSLKVGVDHLFTDLQCLLQGDRVMGERREALEGLERAVDLLAHRLRTRPHLFFQEIYNQASWHDRERRGPLFSLLEDWRGTACAKAWIRSLGPPAHPLRGPLLRTLTGHAGAVTTCAVSSSGKVVSGSDDKTLRVWDLKTGTELAILTGHIETVTACAVTPAGNLAVSASRDETVRLWDLESYRELATFAADIGRLQACTFSCDGMRLITGSEICDGTLSVWHLATGVELMRMMGCDTIASSHTRATRGFYGVQAIAATLDFGLMVWAAHGNTALLTRLPEMLALSVSGDHPRPATYSGEGPGMWIDADDSTRLTGHTDQVLAVAVTPEGNYAITGSWDKSLKVWDLRRGVNLHTLDGHRAPVRACVLTPDGRCIVSGSDDRTLKVWDFATGQETATLEGHADAVLACALTGDGLLAVSASRDCTVRVWNLPASSCETGEDPSIRDVGPHNPAALPIERRSLRPQQATSWIQPQAPRHSGDVRACFALPDGLRVVTASADNSIVVWDLATHQRLATLRGHESGLTCCAASPDGSRLVSAAFDSTLKLWDLAACREIASVSLGGHHVLACAMMPDGCRVLAGLMEYIVLWDLVERAQPSKIAKHMTDPCACLRQGLRNDLYALVAHVSLVSACAVTPDGGRLVSGSSDRLGCGENTLRVWDSASRQVLATLVGHCDGVTSCVVTPDGQRVISGSKDGSVRVWDLNTFSELATLRGHTNGVNACAVLLDGMRAVSASDDTTLRIWDLRGFSEQTVFSVGDRVLCCAIAPDQSQIIAGDSGGRVHFLALKP